MLKSRASWFDIRAFSIAIGLLEGAKPSNLMNAEI